MTFDIDVKPESPRLPLFGRVGAYFVLRQNSPGKGCSCKMMALSFLISMPSRSGTMVSNSYLYIRSLSAIQAETLFEFYEHMFEQGLVHRTIDRFVNILFLGVKILCEAAKGWQIYAFLKGIYRDSS